MFRIFFILSRSPAAIVCLLLFFFQNQVGFFFDFLIGFQTQVVDSFQNLMGKFQNTAWFQNEAGCLENLLIYLILFIFQSVVKQTVKFASLFSNPDSLFQNLLVCFQTHLGCFQTLVERFQNLIIHFLICFQTQVDCFQNLVGQFQHTIGCFQNTAGCFENLLICFQTQIYIFQFVFKPRQPACKICLQTCCFQYLQILQNIFAKVETL